jgi:uncharacterized protein YggE
MASSDFRSFWPEWRANPLFTFLLAFLLLATAGWMVSALRNNLREYGEIGKIPEEHKTIMISGTGKVSGEPNVAEVSVGVVTEGGKDIGTLQKTNAEKMNALIAAFTNLGIAKKELQTTNYSISPRYDYTNGRTMLVGYSIQQNLQVRIFDLTKVSAVFEQAGALGANQVNGPTFTLDDPESLRVTAREKAIENAKEKAEALAKVLGVRLLRVVSFSEDGSGARPPMPYAYSAMDMGGLAAEKAVAPDIQAGTLDVVSNVNVTYEIE